MSETNGYVKPEDLFSTAPKRRYKDVIIEGLGKFRIRSLNAYEAADYESRRINKQGQLDRHGMITANARLVVLCCVDANGDMVFAQEHIAKLQELDAELVSELAEKCRQHCRLDDAEDEAKN